MINAELAKAFARIADLLEIDGADKFRVNSFKRASRTLKDCTEDIETVACEGRLTDLPGIGKGTAERISQFLDTKTMDVLEELEQKLPPGLPALLDIQGMGPKKVALVYEKLDVRNLDDLKQAIDSGQFAELPGLGKASAKKIAEGVAFLETSAGRTPLGIALPIGEEMLARVRNLSGVRRAELAGSIRRGKETIGDIDILCAAENGKEIIEQFVQFEGVIRVLASGATKGSVTVGIEKGRELQIDLRVVEVDSFGAALQYFTGSKEHNVRLRELAIRKKLRLNEYGLFKEEKAIAGEREDGIYGQLGLSLIPPELREDRGELTLADDQLDLVTLKDVRGDLHLHTTASDGKCTIEEMAEACKALGYSYLAICDHSKSSTIANGLTIKRMEEHIAAIREANERVADIEILVGSECDILPDGTLDYPDDLLAQCDWIVASIHSAMGTGSSKKLSATDRTLAAMENRYVCAIGHPTGRLIHRRSAMEMDMSAIVEGALETSTILEINASWHRLDLKDSHARQAMEAGVDLCINTDAHHVDGLAQMRFGVMTAKRGGACKNNIANCATLAGLRKLIGNKRSRNA